MSVDVRVVLKDIIGVCGIGVLDNSKRLAAILSDYHVDKKDINLLICVLQVAFCKDYLFSEKVIHSYHEKQLLIHKIQQEFPFSTDYIEDALDCLFHALGKPIPSVVDSHSEYFFKKDIIQSNPKYFNNAIEIYKKNLMATVSTMSRKTDVIYDDDSDFAVEFNNCFAAAINGDAAACNNLGVLYQEGLGVQKDYKSAFEWYSKAAASSNASAQQNLGWLYRNGYGVEQDYSLALKWYKKAAAQGVAFAQNNIGWMYQLGLGITQSYKSASIWYKKSADALNTYAMINLGWLYEKGLGVDLDYSRAMSLYAKAAELGDFAGLNNMAFLFEKGLGVTRDFDQALRLYLQSAQKGLTLAQININRLFLNRVVPHELKDLLLKLFELSESLKDPYMQRCLAWVLQNGCGTDIDVDAAKKWYRRAALQGDVDSEYMIGFLYYNSKETKAHYKEGLMWLKRAASHGNENARLVLQKSV